MAEQLQQPYHRPVVLSKLHLWQQLSNSVLVQWNVDSALWKLQR
jgi:hypothetical protein